MITTELKTCENRPNIEVLQEFAKGYFRKNPPSVVWHEFDPKENTAGYADKEKNQIRINPVIPLKREFCNVGHFCVIYDDLMLAPGEQYFHVLLHEIGHFKISFEGKVRVPKGYAGLKRKINYIYKTREPRPGELEYIVEDYLSKYYTDEFIEGQVDDFWAYYNYDDFADDHTAVEDWARAEFKKRRAEIRALI